MALNHDNVTHYDHPTLRPSEREAIGTELQRALVMLIDLAAIGKQAHWNVVGSHFRELHLQLDEMVDSWRDAADVVAERAVALGQWPDGRTVTVADHSPLTPLADGPQPDRALVASLTAILKAAVGVMRQCTDRSDERDSVTGDLLRGIVATLEKQLWMIRVRVT
jgi:starvation-inducible DNA-binding protein